jgi:hypothetical protein
VIPAQPHLEVNVSRLEEEFSYELSQIQNSDIKSLLIKTGMVIPPYFFTIPASSTGKYHPQYCLGNGGLLRHTKACVRIALELFRNDTVQDFAQEEKDLIIAALILHDTAKNGFNGSMYTVVEHPLLVKELFKKADLNEAEQKHAEFIGSLIDSHMGQWNTDRSGREVLPKPKKKIERFVHLADYLGSRKCIEVNFNAVG